MKKTAFIILIMIIFSFASCDFLIAPQRGRENPNDPNTPLSNFSTYAINENTLIITFQWPESFPDDEEAPNAVWFFIREDSPPDTVESSYEDGNAWDVEWRRWDDIVQSGSDYTTEYYIEGVNQDSIYYGAGFWTYEDGNENDPYLEWFGPIYDEASFQTSSMTLTTTEDGEIHETWGNNFTASNLTVSGQTGGYHSLGLLRFNSSEFPEFISSAELWLKYNGGTPSSPQQVFNVHLVNSYWDTGSDDYASMSGDNKIYTGDSSSFTVPSDVGAGDPFSADVTSLINEWKISGTGEGFRITAANDGDNQVDFRTLEYDDDADVDAAQLTLFYWDEEEE